MMDPAVVHFSTIFMAFFAIMNPIANAPIFVSLTQGLSAAARRAVAARAVLVSFAIVSLFAVSGGPIFQLFGIDLAGFRITGGILIALVGFQMLHGQSSAVHTPSDAATASPEVDLDLAVSPLAMSIPAGPGTIATAMSFTAHGDLRDVLEALGAFAAICAVTFAAFVGGERLTRTLGPHVIGVVTRLMGLILAVIGVDMLIDGIRAAFDFARPAAS
jgi:multiple antibiotic resistance protein